MLVVTAIMDRIGMGIFALILAYRAPEARRELAKAVEEEEFWSQGMGIAWRCCTACITS